MYLVNVQRACCGIRRLSSFVERSASSACGNLKVAIIGASGDTGRTLALCLKQSSIIDELSIYDRYPARGLLLELTHMNSRCKTLDHGDDDLASGRKGLERALVGAKIVAIVSESKELCDEARYLEKIVPGLLRYCPKAFVAVVSRSVNTLLPMLFELYKKAGVFECNRLFGVLNLYSTRANTFAAQTLNIDPEFVSVPVIGGGCLRTCVPIFSHTRPCADFTPEELARLRQAMKSQDFTESSSLCQGFSAARFCISLCKALRAEPGVHECAYVRSCLIPELKYIGAPLELGPCGIQKHLGIPRLTNQECDDLYRAIPEIKRQIGLGESLALGLKESTEACPVLEHGCTALQLYQPHAT